MNHLELFSGTHSFGKVSSKLGYNVISLDRDLGATCPFNSGYESDIHIKADILNWDYTVYPKDHFKLITASPVCSWWSHLRRCWLGRPLKAHGGLPFSYDLWYQDIEKYGIPMVDKVFEILDYFNPKYFIVENPKHGKMKEYICELIPYKDVDYCMYGFAYKKSTRFWTNIEFTPTKCNHKRHSLQLGHSETGSTTLYERYRIPERLIEEIFKELH